MDKAAAYSDVTYQNTPDRSAAQEMLRTLADRNCAFTPRAVDKPLILYGAGNLGKMAKDYLFHIGIPFQYVVDANPAAYTKDPHWEGTDILAPDEVPESDKTSSLLAVCISTIPYVPLQRSLATQGWRDLLPFYDITEAYRDRHPLGNGWFCAHLNNDDIIGISRVLDLWEDDISRAHHLQFLAWRCLREEWTFEYAPVTTNDRYFIQQVCSTLHEHEDFLDIGAHHGEVSIRFSDLVNAEFDGITAIEPEPHNVLIMKENFAKTFSSKTLNKTTILNNVIASKVGSCRFHDGLGYASQITTLGQRDAILSNIDSLIISPSFIKLHLEGGEFDAIKGGNRTILSNRPIITATAYHNNDGLWKMFDWLMVSLHNYHFFLRLHGWCGTGLVVYAIPNERIADVF